ncbi:MAG: VWA domain-containing protein [Rikenellaceae bacterium]|jgi:Ca-activated chloride channel family protein|nr:VWA domain-containing protein [Bacteroidales bacterium]
MLQFAQPQFLLLILLIPILFIAYAMMRRSRKKRIERFGNSSTINELIPKASKSRGWIKLSIYSIAFFFFVIGLARPQLGAKIKEVETKGVEIIIALDVSNSMLAEDYSPNRLERAKLAISRLVDKMKEDRIGLVVFAGQAFVQLPVTTDYVSAKMFLNSINTNSVPVQGTAMADAINTCIKSFSQDSKNSRAIILITDGENHEDDPVEAAKNANSLGIQVYTIGIGSPEGKPIPLPEGGFLKDKDGNMVVSKLDERTLVDVAKAGGGVYVKAGNSDFGLDAVVERIHNLEKQTYKSVVFEDFDEQYMYFFAIALVLFILDFLIVNRKGKNLFK